MAIDIEIKLCDADRDRLDRLLNMLGSIAAATALLSNRQAASVSTAPQEGAEAPLHGTFAPGGSDIPEEVSPHQETADAAPEASEAQQTYSQSDIMTLVRKLIRPGSPHREQAKAIVQEYAPKVSGIPEEKFNEVMTRLKALEEEAHA